MICGVNDLFLFVSFSNEIKRQLILPGVNCNETYKWQNNPYLQIK